ncbi:MAG: hypothetical protein PUP92_05985 [Rhizonema sp. PD38]|nr:hypothetical protein [Rhizonema sp. PD38]
MILPRVGRWDTTIASTYIKHLEVYNLYEHLPKHLSTNHCQLNLWTSQALP